MDKVTLYKFKDSGISITIEAYFNEKGDLVVEGYDIGAKVEDAWGDSDYEYVTTIPRQELEKLYTLMKVQYGSQEELLQAIAKKYNSNTCYSEFNDLLSSNGINSEGFSWT